jgi:hypothetical protein
MRITRDTLLNNARDAVAQRTRSDRTIVAVYLAGSLLEPEYLLGGTADIDLFFIHSDGTSTGREIVRLTDEVHLDIAHHRYLDYRNTRNLRVDAWLGPTLKACRPMHDPQHLLDFTIASVRGQFDRPDHVLERAQKQAETARGIWLAFHDRKFEQGPAQVIEYLRAVGLAANAIASLSGAPLTERRFLLTFPARAAAVGKPGLHAGLLGLLGAPNLEADTLAAWVALWQAAYRALPEQEAPLRLHPHRLIYYRQAYQALLEGSQPLAVLWPLLRTWTLAVGTLQAAAPAASPADYFTPWQQAFAYLGLLGSEFLDRLSALDSYLDLVEETLEIWGRKAGV